MTLFLFLSCPIVDSWEINMLSLVAETDALLAYKRKKHLRKDYVHLSLMIEKRNYKRGGRTVIAYGFNDMYVNDRYSIHSEEACLRKVHLKRMSRMRPLELLNLAITQGRAFRMSKPCCACQNRIRNSLFRIRRVWWSTSQ